VTGDDRLDEKDTLAAIKERLGYWTIVVRPATFKADHAANRLSQLEEILRRSSVLIRGWDFPHVSDHDDFDRGRDWIGQRTVWGFHRELWRLYLSGQFTTYRALWEDWLDNSHWQRSPPEGWQPGTELSVASALYTYVEIFEFAARLSVTPAGAEDMVVDTTLFGLKGRRLASDPHRMPFIRERRATIDSFPYRLQTSRESLVAAPRDRAIDAAILLFEQFGWDTDHEHMRGILEELKRW
jgi:hypothetical protein